MTASRLNQPIGILDEHPTWSNRLIAELTSRGLPWEKIDVGAHGFQPDERARAWGEL